VGDDDEPAIGHPLPRADEAFIDPAKLVDYALNPEHPRGRDEAIPFKRALAIERNDWRYLRDRILVALPRHPVATVHRPERPEELTTWTVPIPIRGLNGRVLMVITVWKVVRGRPELVSTWVVDKRRQSRPRGTTL
jgi:hypothetical protein